MKTLSTIKSTKSNSPRSSMMSILHMNSAAGTMRAKLLLFQKYKKGLWEVSPLLAKVGTSQLLVWEGWERVLALLRKVSILKQCLPKSLNFSSKIGKVREILKMQSSCSHFSCLGAFTGSLWGIWGGIQLQGCPLFESFFIFVCCILWSKEARNKKR